MKMDLRFITTTSNKEIEDHGYGEFAKECSSPKYFKDKLKNVISSKALYNSIAQKSGLKPEDCLSIPFIVVMGFEIHLCALHKEEELYVCQKIRSMVFPVARGNFAEEAANLKEGLCELVDMCEKIKSESCRGTKRKSMDSCLGFEAQSIVKPHLTKVIWDDARGYRFEQEEEDESDDDEEEETDSNEVEDSEDEEEEEEDH